MPLHLITSRFILIVVEVKLSMKICKLCGKEFEPESNAQQICKDIHYRSCEVCGTKFVITRPSSSQLCCSKECSEKKRQATMLSRYGVAHALENRQLLDKAQNTTLKRYGVKHAAQSSVIKAKVKEQFNDKYGVDSPFQMDDFWDKARKTNLEKYGTEYAIQSAAVQKKSEQTCKERYGASHSIQSSEIKDRVEKSCLEKYGVPYPCMTDQCRESSASVISKLNKSVAEKIADETALECELDKVKIDKFSYDIHITGTNILLEVDPTYTHNALGNHWDTNGLDKEYHLHKTELAPREGYRCLHIFDWDSIDKIVSLLAPKQSVYARKCTIKTLNAITASEFEDSYHLQGGCRGQSVCLGLMYQNELIQVMTFGKPRYNKKYQWELLRLCTDTKYKVVGGAQKLFAHFVHDYSPESVISYCDISKFSGDVYERLGFQLLQITEPNKVWSKGTKKVTNNLLLLRGYDQLFQTNYGKGTSNEALMIKDGWLPVYDCGQKVFEWRFK